jgi:hypothetical protein
MRTKLLFRLLLLTSFIVVTNESGARPKKLKWAVCLQAAGTTCGGVCMSTATEYSRKDPCAVYDHWYYAGSPPVLTKAVCCSGVAGGSSTSGGGGGTPINYHGMNFYLASDTFQIKRVCLGEATDPVVIDFTHLIDTGWEITHIDWYKDVSTDEIVINAYQGDGYPPYYVPSSLIQLRYGSEQIGSPACPETMQTSINNVYDLSSLKTDFYPNPSIGNELTYKLESPDVLKEKVTFKFYNSMGQLLIEVQPLESTGTIDISSFPQGLVFAIVSTVSGSESYKIAINR